jgi:hypothetical protein
MCKLDSISCPAMQMVDVSGKNFESYDLSNYFVETAGLAAQKSFSGNSVSRISIYGICGSAA